MIGHRSRSRALRWLSRCNRCRIDPRLRNEQPVGSASAYPLLLALSSPPPPLRSDFPSASHCRRHFSSLFMNSLMQNQRSNGHDVRNNNNEGGGGKSEIVPTPGKRENRSTDNQNNPNKGQNYGQRPGGHSTRLISESAARSTTQIFIDAFESSNGQSNNVAARENDDAALPWKDARSLLAAEHALEFWAHRNNNSDKGRNNKHSKRNTQSLLEKDANMALNLFTALHHFHCRDGRVLNNGIYSNVIDALAKSPNPDHVRKADALLRQFIALYVKHHANAVEGKDVSSLLQALELSEPSPMKYNSTKSPFNASFSPPSISLAMPRDIEWSHKDNHHFPNQIRITGVMRGYARQSRPQCAESLLSLMIALSWGGNKLMFRPNEIGFATVIDAYSRLHDGINAERVLQLMKRRSFGTGVALDSEVLKKNGMSHINAANVVAYNAAISAWARSARQSSSSQGDMAVSEPSQAAKSASRAAAERAESLLREMWAEHEKKSGRNRRHKDPRNTVLPDVVTYSTVISAFATCLDHPYGMQRAQELLMELEGLATQEFNESRRSSDEEQNTTALTARGGGRNPHGFQPNSTVYNALLQACANAGDASSAETVLRSMLSLHSTSSGDRGPYRHVRPNTRTFNVVLNAWSKSGDRDRGLRASKILDRLEKMASDGNMMVRPDVISYNTVLAAWSKSASVDPSTLSDKDKSSQLLNSSIVGEHAAYEALKLLDKVEDRYMKSQGDMHQHHHHAVKPDVISYNTTIAAFANAAQHSKNGTSLAEEAEAIIFRMKDRLGIEPDGYSYNGVLLAWARSSGGVPAAKRAESILRSMSDPTLVSWSTVVTAYAHADSAPRAEALLREMELSAINRSGQRKVTHHPIVPSIVLYNNVLHAWGKSSDMDASKNAEVIIERMENTSSKLPKPDVISYRLVLTALEHTKDHDKAERANSVLSRLLAFTQGRSHGAKHSEIQNAYNSVLTACAYTPVDAGKAHRKNASNIMVRTLRDMNQFPWSADSGIDGPNQESYALFMQGCSHLFEAQSEERNMLLKSAFRECCQKGLLNAIIWDKFCSTARPEFVKMFIQDFSSGSGTDINNPSEGMSDRQSDLWKYEELPKAWSSSGP